MTDSTRRVLGVGNCGPDHGSLQRLLETKFGATLDGANTAEEARQAVAKHDYRLVVVNRVFDWDGASGLELIESLQGAGVPTMLLSNYTEYQQQAESLGASPGFGKSQLSDPDTIDKLAQHLGPPVAP